MRLAKYSIGVGDRFAHQARAQLRACMLASGKGVDVIPVWNKSNREHRLVGSHPESVLEAAKSAVKELGWTKPYHVDADHIRLETVEGFLRYADFFTLDVADSIGRLPATDAVMAFVRQHPELSGKLRIPGIAVNFEVNRAEVARIAGKYLMAVTDASRIYRLIANRKGSQPFITEVSMDETDRPQTPLELLVILVALADAGVPVQTIAPKFTGRFNKGVDYRGDVAQFEKEFNEDLAVIAYAVKRHGLPANLKLSIHSGSDKFSIYGPIRQALARWDAGLHLKTAGTTWLEEVIGLAEAGGEGLALAKELYQEALEQVEELCAPYATVIEIDRNLLPGAAAVSAWTSEQYVAALRHDPKCADFNPHLRQLLHVSYKLAAHQGDRFRRLLKECEPTIARNVTTNLWERHIQPVFLGS
jgi:tagaturonate epimerase